MGVTPPPGWISLTQHRAGVLAVAICATISLVAIGFLTTFIGVLLYRYYTNGNKVEKSEQRRESKAIRFLSSSHFILFGDLLFGDLLQAIGFFLNYSWFRRGGLPPPLEPNALCTTQAVLIQLGDVASAFSSLIISVNLFVIVVFSRHPSVKALWIVILFQWLITGLLAGIGPRWLETSDQVFYGDAGGWCWITKRYEPARLWLHYIFVFVIAFLDLVLYSLIALHLAIQNRRSARSLGTSASNRAITSGFSGVSKIMLLYPMSYVVTILPLSAFRAASMAGRQWSLEAQFAAGSVFTLSGAVNCLIYATTRNIISAESVGAIRRGSTSVTSGNFDGTASKHPIRDFFFSRRRSAIGTNHLTAQQTTSHSKPRGKGGIFTSKSTGTTSFDPPSSSTSTGGIRVQVETQIDLPDYSNGSPDSTKGRFNDDEEEDEDYVGGGRGNRRVLPFDFADGDDEMRTVGGGGADWGRIRAREAQRERERIRDREREVEMERDVARSAQHGDRTVEAPFTSLRRVDWAV